LTRGDVEPVNLTTNLRDEVIVDGKRLETLWIQSSAKRNPTIVILHEGLGSIALWKDFPAQLAARTGANVLVYSRYGHGSSDKLMEKRPVNFMHREGEVVLPQLLDKLSIEHPILLGHSDGGSISLIFAGRYPERPRALILEAPHVFVEDLSVANITQAKVNYEATELRQKLSRYHAFVDETFWGWNDIWLDPNFRSWNIEEYLTTIRCPVLCIQGEQDEYGTRAQVDGIAAQMPQAEVMMLPNCKHSPHRDQPEKTLDSIAGFVSRVVRSDDPRAATRERPASVGSALQPETS
jgi:pimeloyl-ACP methyl ester carboxylesterase